MRQFQLNLMLSGGGCSVGITLNRGITFNRLEETKQKAGDANRSKITDNLQERVRTF